MLFHILSQPRPAAIEAVLTVSRHSETEHNKKAEAAELSLQLHRMSIIMGVEVRTRLR